MQCWKRFFEKPSILSVVFPLSLFEIDHTMQTSTCIALCLILSVRSSDTEEVPQESALSQSTSMQQTICMQRVLEPCTYGSFRTMYKPLLAHLQGASSIAHDSCTWKGIECEDGAIKSVLIDRGMYGQPFNDRFIVNIHWLPSTVEYVHIRNMSLLNDWRPERLPRQLRYLLLSECGRHCLYSDESVKAGRASFARVNLQALPAGLVELYILGSWEKGSLAIGLLPEGLRRLHISGWSLKHAYIQYEVLPESLQAASFVSNMHRKDLKVHAVGRQKRDDRVYINQKTAAIRQFVAESEVYKAFCEKSHKLKAPRERLMRQ